MSKNCYKNVGKELKSEFENRVKKVEIRYSRAKVGFYFLIWEKEWESLFLSEEEMFYFMNGVSGYEIPEVICYVLYAYKLDKKLVQHAKGITCHRKGIKENTIRLERKGGRYDSRYCHEHDHNGNISRALINRKAGIVRGVYEWFKEGELVLRKARGDKRTSDKEIWDEYVKMVAKRKVN